MTTQDKYAEKIAKLLRKAESTTPEEAELLVAKAQELMTSYAIDQLMIDRALGENRQTREEITQVALEYTGIFQSILMGIGSTVARNNDCRGVYHVREAGWERDPETGKKRPKAHILTVTGFERDVARIQMLDASLQIQCARATQTWWKEKDRSWYSKMDAFKERRTFIAGFIAGMSEQLRAAAVAGRQEAERNEAVRSNISTEEATKSVGLAIRSRKDQVNDWMDKKYGRIRSGRGRSYSSGSSNAYGAGQAAGRRADMGGGSVGGSSRKGLGR